MLTHHQWGSVTRTDSTGNAQDTNSWNYFKKYILKLLPYVSIVYVHEKYGWPTNIIFKAIFFSVLLCIVSRQRSVFLLFKSTIHHSFNYFVHLKYVHIYSCSDGNQCTLFRFSISHKQMTARISGQADLNIILYVSGCKNICNIYQDIMLN